MNGSRSRTNTTPRCWVRLDRLPVAEENRPSSEPTAAPKKRLKLRSASPEIRLRSQAVSSWDLLCGKPCCSLAGLRRTHEEERPFRCAFCAKLFDYKYLRERHERVHTGERPFACRRCPKRFFVRSTLQKHERAHEGQAFPCALCGRAFSYKCDRNSHERIHTGERPFACQRCPLRFVERGALRKHERMQHGGEQPFECAFCEMKTPHRCLKQDGQAVQHFGEQPFECASCEMKTPHRCLEQDGQTVQQPRRKTMLERFCRDRKSVV